MCRRVRGVGTQRERTRNTLFYKDCSLGSVQPVSQLVLAKRLTGKLKKKRKKRQVIVHIKRERERERTRTRKEREREQYGINPRCTFFCHSSSAAKIALGLFPAARYGACGRHRPCWQTCSLECQGQSQRCQTTQTIRPQHLAVTRWPHKLTTTQSVSQATLTNT